MRLALTLLIASSMPCYSHCQSPDNAATPSPSTVLHASTQLVVVNVGVEDRSGAPVRGLVRDDFRITENRVTQTLRNFEVHSSDDGISRQPIPELPPGTFTDYTPVNPNAPLNIILLDSLNTDIKDLPYVRQQLGEYLNHSDPKAQIAIFGLSSRLTILQGFTSDSNVLRAAVEHRSISRPSPLLEDARQAKPSDQLGSFAASSAGAGELAETAANLKQFEAEQSAFQIRLRIKYTLDAFSQIARYLSGFPGRKNLIWFSGSFPLSISPDDSLLNPFAVLADSESEYRETATLLSRSQVAVYPVDARGLMVNPAFSAASSGQEFKDPRAITAAIIKFTQSQAAEHDTLDKLANDTGGRAFYNTNGLTEAVKKVMQTGSNYYSLFYSPSNSKRDGEYRAIRVELSGSAAARGYKLAYRRGYYAVDTNPDLRRDAAETSATAVADLKQQRIRLNSALQRGAPTPSELLFKVKILPTSNASEDKPTSDDQPKLPAKFKAPFRRYDIDCASLPQGFTWEKSPDGRYQSSVILDVYVYDSDGLLLNFASKGARLNVDGALLNTLMKQGLQTHLQVSAPIKGDNYFRIALRDGESERLGIVEVPISEVSQLPPQNASELGKTPQKASETSLPNSSQ